MGVLRKALMSLLLLLLVSSCGGGGDGDGSDEGVSNASPGGIWRGNVTSTSTGISYQSIGFITEVGELRFITDDGEQTVGNITVNGNSYTANITSYAPIGSVFPQNGLTVISGTASGSINERSTFSGSASISGTVTSNFSFTYDTIYERNSSLSAISGIYSESDGFGYTETYAIDSNG